jgi:hypothetical protein
MILKPFKFIFSVIPVLEYSVKRREKWEYYTKLSKCCCLNDFRQLLNYAFPSENSPLWKQSPVGVDLLHLSALEILLWNSGAHVRILGWEKLGKPVSYRGQMVYDQRESKKTTGQVFFWASNFRGLLDYVGQCILFSVVFTTPPPSHHGSIWLLSVI